MSRFKENDIVLNRDGKPYRIINFPNNSLSNAVGLVHMAAIKELNLFTGEIISEFPNTGFNRLSGFTKFVPEKDKLSWWRNLLNKFKQ